MEPETRWLMPRSVQAAPTGTMRFFAQPRWAPGSHSIDHGMRRRDTHAYSELEFEAIFDEGSVVGVMYVLPRGNAPAFFASCFGSLFQPIRRILFGPGDNHQRQGFADEMRRVRPLYMATTSNGLCNDFREGALIQYDDPNDTIGKTLLVCRTETSVPDLEHLDLADLGMDALGGLFTLSFLIFEEMFLPLDERQIELRAELAELRETAASSTKWFFEHSHEISDIVRILTG